jgi:Lon protease-like protein
MQEDIVAVFPLPNVIFFPQTNLPLHIFEPRYCEMIRDTVENKQLIGMFLLQPGWQDDYYGNPPVYSVGCAGELIHVENLQEGKYNIILRGVNRIRAVETIQEYPYRKVRVHILPDRSSAEEKAEAAIKSKLLKDFRLFMKYADESQVEILDKEADLVQVVNSVAMTLQIDIEEKRRMLEEEDVYLRAMMVGTHLSSAVAVLKLTARFSHLRPIDPNVN